jgi:hypothetical protein
MRWCVSGVSVKRDDVGAAEQFSEGHVFGSGVARLVAWPGIVREDPEAEAGHDAAEDRTDFSRADHTHRAAVEVETEQAVEREVAFPDPVESWPCSRFASSSA